MRFKAIIDGIHFDKEGSVKIVLIGASHVSLDELTTLSPKDEAIQVTFESEQTKIEVFPRTLNGVAIEPGSREERELEEDHIVTEFQTPAAEEESDPITLSEGAVAKLKEAAERLEEGHVVEREEEGEIT